MALPHDSDDMVGGVSDAIEFEETFPEGSAPAPRAAAPRAAAPKLSVVPEAPQDTEARDEVRRLERRLHDTEAIVKKTMDTVRDDEERRLTEWARSRREDEERRRERYDRRSHETREESADAIVRRFEERLEDWQAKFEEQQEQRFADLKNAIDESAKRAEQSQRDAELRSALRAAMTDAPTARDAGRILRDAIGELADTTAMAVALHDRTGAVAYRYRVATEDEVGGAIRGEVLDDGVDSAAAHNDGWLRANRTVRAGGRNVAIYTAQLAVRSGEMTIGVLTLQAQDPLSDAVLGRIALLATLVAPRFAALRDAGAFRAA